MNQNTTESGDIEPAVPGGYALDIALVLLFVALAIGLGIEILQATAEKRHMQETYERLEREHSELVDRNETLQEKRWRLQYDEAAMERELREQMDMLAPNEYRFQPGPSSD